MSYCGFHELMVVLRCTQKLLVRLKQVGDLPPVESTTRLGDWYGNILWIGRRQHLLFISERSRLPVVIPITESKRLGTVFPDAVCERLAIVGIAAADIADERMRMSELALRGTRNRSLLGTLNDFAFMAQSGSARRTEPESPEELMRFLSQTPILPLDGATPIELTRARLVVNQCRDGHGLASLRSSILGERAGRVKTPLSALRGLDPPSALPWFRQLPERRSDQRRRFE
jgi:hypothetical protein